jgi:hypothetical protein
VAEPFERSRYRIATDTMGEAGFEDVAEWVKERIDEEDRRLVRRQSVVQRIMQDCFESNFRHPFAPEMRYWLDSVRPLICGLKIEIGTLEPDPMSDEIRLVMRVLIQGREFACEDRIIIGRYVSRALDRCYGRLMSMIWTNIDPV